MGVFKVLSKVKLDDLNVNDELSESDFATLTPSGNFVQLKYFEEENSVKKHYDVKPGVWAIKGTQMGFTLKQTSFVKDRVLGSFYSTKAVMEKIESFFGRFQVYYDHGFEVPKRGMLFYGPPGTGKSTIISIATEKYANDGKTAIVVWPTDKYEAWKVKDFIKTFNYVDGVEKLILIAEDIGGVEMDQVRMRSDSSLLSLLDNQEKTFTIPVLILATTNFPEVFLGNLTNRPNRFDDKFEVGFPKGEHRVELLKFFSKTEISEEAAKLMEGRKADKFSPAHIREVIIRSAIYDQPVEKTIEDMSAEIEHYENAFSKKKAMGMGFGGMDD
jgi:hypothetical protein